MRVAVIGASGQLGTDLCAAFHAAGDEVSPLAHEDVRVEDYDSVVAALRGLRAGLVVNTAAFHNVDKCEAEPERAFAVNAVGVRNLAEACQETGAELVHFSTDYVFDGAKNEPYVESDAPRPLNTYGVSKLAGEHFALLDRGRASVLRVSALYGKHPCRAKGGLNFVDTMLRLGREKGSVRVVADQFVSPTPTADVAAQAVALSRAGCHGLFHATAEGSCSWYDFAKAIFAAAKVKAEVTPISTRDLLAATLRPKYSVLENRHLKEHGVNKFRSWQDGLEEYLHGV